LVEVIVVLLVAILVSIDVRLTVMAAFVSNHKSTFLINFLVTAGVVHLMLKSDIDVVWRLLPLGPARNILLHLLIFLVLKLPNFYIIIHLLNYWRLFELMLLLLLILRPPLEWLVVGSLISNYRILN
jgi:hypothetical protein